MKTQLMTNGRKWSLYSALVAVMVYSVLILNSQPTYAYACTTTFCTYIAPAQCKSFCRNEGGVYLLSCPIGAAQFFCVCKNDLNMYESC
jgi:hypothetical protein